MKAFAIAVSSSDAERSFSIMNVVKTKSRNRMKIELLEANMGVKINAADSVFEFPALYYSKKWKEAGHLLIDDPNHPAHRPSLDEFELESDLRRNTRLLSGHSTLF